MPPSIREPSLYHDGNLWFRHSVLDAFGTHWGPAQEGSKPGIELVLSGWPQMDLELGIVNQDIYVSRVRLAIVGRLDVASSQVGDQGAGVGIVVFGLIDQTAGLVIDIAV